MLIDREAAIDQFRTRAKQHYAEAQSCEDATEETRLGGVYAGLYEAMKIIESLPAIGTCKDCALSSRYLSKLECCGQNIEVKVMDDSGLEYHLWVKPDHSCTAWRAKP